MSVILWWTPADCLSTAAVFPPRSKWKGQGRGMLCFEVLPDFILSGQYCAKVLDMDQQCSKRMAEKSKPTQYWFDSPFAVIIIFFNFFFRRNSAGWLFQTSQRSSHKSPVAIGFLLNSVFWLLIVLIVKTDRIVDDETCKKPPQCFIYCGTTLQQTAFCNCQIFSILTLWARAPAAIFLAPCCLWATWKELEQQDVHIPTLNPTEFLTV